MTQETKQFDLGTVLTISNGRLLTKIDGVYEILNWMTQDSLYTHQLPRAMRECRPWLLRWFPELEALNLPSPMAALDRLIELYGASEGCQTWVRQQPESYPLVKSVYDVPRIPRDDHDVIDPLAELATMVDPSKIVAVHVD